MHRLTLQLFVLLMAACLAAAALGADTPARPAFVAASYFPGTIQPDHLPRAELDRQLVALYNDWKTTYLTQACGTGRYLVKVDADGKPVGGGTAPGTLTVSEAHGYAMLISVMMAAADPQAKTVFDGMFRYFQDHPARSDHGLMAWNQVHGCGNAGAPFDGENSATDGDMDIAYALLLADKTWGSKGQIDYLGEAKTVMKAVLEHEVHPNASHLLLGDWVNADDNPEIEFSTRSSDFMTSHLYAFFLATQDRRWLSVRDRTYFIIKSILRNHAKDTGLMPDFISRLNQSPSPARGELLEGAHDGDYSWNAARYPWRVGLDYLLYGDQRAFRALVPFNRWARNSTTNRPKAFHDGYLLDGKPLADEGSDSPAFIAALGVSAMISGDNQAWLNGIWDDLQQQSLSSNDYYANTLKLLGMLVMSGHWQKPLTPVWFDSP
ncbi:glycosyl hydrolase family 8 [Pseudomonas gingeri]